MKSTRQILNKSALLPMNLIYSECNEFSLPSIFDYLNNIIIFEDDIKKARYAIEDNIAPSKGLYEKIQHLLDFFDEQKKLYLAKEQMADKEDSFKFPLDIPMDILTYTSAFMPINQRLLFRLVNHFFKHIVDDIPLKETLIFPKSLAKFNGFIQTNINESRFRTKHNSTLGNLIKLLSNLSQNDKDALTNIIKGHAFAINEGESKEVVERKFAYAFPQEITMGIAAKQNFHAILPYVLGLIFWLPAYYLYDSMRPMENRSSNEHLGAVAAITLFSIVMTMIFNPKYRFSNQASEKVSQNANVFFKSMTPSSNNDCSDKLDRRRSYSI